jgi:4-alpha-glucanotransferase
MDKRKSGILLHITSLPSKYGIGDLGPEAYRFADFLSETKQAYWQILPLNPTLTVFGNSPYSSYSTFAGNYLLISPELLYTKGLLSKEELEFGIADYESKVNYESVGKYKYEMLDSAYNNFISGFQQMEEYNKFCETNSAWLDDYVLFVSLKEYFRGVSWNHYPEEIAERHRTSIEEFTKKLNNRINKEKFIQYIFFEQWLSLKEYCNNINIKIIGDLPIYVNYDSSDVWCNPDNFKLDEQNRPRYVSGVPPDYFSKTGQLWGNPVYDWDHMKPARYKWWLTRLVHHFKLCDIIRIDHFRGLVAYWEIPTSEKTAIKGKWVDVPADDFFSVLLDVFPPEKFIAEDLGTITPDVIEIRDKFNFPGMKVLQFAFGDDYPNGSYLPHNHIENCVVYTGTHDNNTLVGWWNNECTIEQKNRIMDYFNRELDSKNINWELIEIAMGSIANTVIIPMQDLFGLDDSARMNTPSKKQGNWEWKYTKNSLTPILKESLINITESNART